MTSTFGNTYAKDLSGINPVNKYFSQIHSILYQFMKKIKRAIIAEFP